MLEFHALRNGRPSARQYHDTHYPETTTSRWLSQMMMGRLLWASPLMKKKLKTIDTMMPHDVELSKSHGDHDEPLKMAATRTPRRA